ncbi:hypothetical protein GWI33_000999 [Rhynchophorus ferrugineus]|uniref:Uncharacterized protein n=1 Tax=Rhynchophorus ferrugineus TaxID=354439 RepID=A0A834M178_RHYFE|nr:hypothetical protein GWI33_000999 [Rhynchophorus ferrugineus]
MVYPTKAVPVTSKLVKKLSYVLGRQVWPRRASTTGDRLMFYLSITGIKVDIFRIGNKPSTGPRDRFAKPQHNDDKCDPGPARTRSSITMANCDIGVQFVERLYYDNIFVFTGAINDIRADELVSFVLELMYVRTFGELRVHQWIRKLSRPFRLFIGCNRTVEEYCMYLKPESDRDIGGYDLSILSALQTENND